MIHNERERENMKKLTTSILLALFSVTIFTPTHVEASWLSKTWKKVEKSWNEEGKQSTSTGMSGSSTSSIRSIRVDIIQVKL